MYYPQCVVAMESGSLIQDYMIAQVSSSMEGFNTFLRSDSEVVCGDPSSPVNGRVGRPSGSGLGSTVSFQCSEGLSPPWVMNSTCNINGTWSPNPGELICTSPDVGTSREGGDGVSTTARTTTTVVTGSVIPVNQGKG